MTGKEIDVQKILIHVGYHKTASTWMQNKLFTSSNLTFEPLSNREKGYSSLAENFIFDRDKYLLSSFDTNKEVIEEELKKIQAAKAHLKNKHFVMSFERLSGNPHSGGFDAKTIASRIKEIFPTAQILLVIREQKSFLLSNYFQYLSIGGVHSIQKYLTTKYDGKRPCFSPHHINYLALIKKYHQLFGKENVLVLPYEMFKSAPIKFILKLEKFIGRKIVIEENMFEIFINKKSNHFVNYHFRLLNLLIKSSSVNDHSVLKTVFVEIPTRFFLTLIASFVPNYFDRKIQKKIQTYIDTWVMDRYLKSNQELSQLIDFDLSKYDYH